jgi:thioesterase domain-containing protein
MFQSPTPSSFTHALSQTEESHATSDPLVALQPLGQRPPFFCVHSIGGGILHFGALAHHMGRDRPFLALRSTAEDDRSEGIEQIAARYVSAVLARQPAGLFYLGGYSFGAMIAYEMARQMTEQGHKIGLLAIIDYRWPGWRLTPKNVWSTLYQSLANIPGFVRDEAANFGAVRLIGQIRRTLHGWFISAFGLRPSLSSALDLTRFEPESLLSIEAHFRAALAYKPRRCVVPIAVFRANVQAVRHPCNDAALGWGIVADGAVTVHRIPGNHNSMITEPHVRKLAESLSKALDRRDKILRSSPAGSGSRDAASPVANS